MDVDKEKVIGIITSLSPDKRRDFIKRLADLYERETQVILSHIRRVEKLKSTPPETIASFKQTIANNLITIDGFKQIVEKLSNAEKKSDNETTKTIEALKPIRQKKSRKS